MFKVGKVSPGVLNSTQQKFQFEILLIGTVHSSCTDPTQATACYSSSMQVTKEQYWGQKFCQKERDISVRPTKMTRPVKVDHLQSSVLNSSQTKLKWSIPSDEPTEISGILGRMESAQGLLSLKDTKVYP